MVPHGWLASEEAPEWSEPRVSEHGRPQLFMMLPGPVVCSWLVEPDKETIAQSPPGNLQAQKVHTVLVTQWMRKPSWWCCFRGVRVSCDQRMPV